ncbi:MAG: CopG family transcriptional regulator [Parvularculaceae bacterium]
MKKARLQVRLGEKAETLLSRAAERPGVTKASIVEAAIVELLNPKEDSQEYAALIKRLDKLTRAMERLADDASAQTETLALYILYYLCITPPLPEQNRAAAEALGQKRFERFISQVGDRLMGQERFTDTLLEHMGLTAATSEQRGEAVQ